MALNWLKLVYQAKWGILLYISSFLVFFVALFPYHTVKDPLLNKLSQAARISIFADQIFPNWDLSLIAQNLRLESPDNGSIVYLVRQLKIRPSLLGFFTKPVVNIDIMGLFGGNGVVKIQKDSPLVRFNMHFDDIELKKIPDLKFWFENNIPELAEIRTLVSGDVLGNAIPGRTETLDGRVNIKLRKISIPGFIYNGFNLPEINFTQGQINLRIFKRKIEIEGIHLGTPSTDIEIDVKGSGMLNNTVKLSDIILNVEIRINEKLKGNSTINALTTLGEAYWDNLGKKYRIRLPISGGQLGAVSKF